RQKDASTFPIRDRLRPMKYSRPSSYALKLPQYRFRADERLERANGSIPIQIYAAAGKRRMESLRLVDKRRIQNREESRAELAPCCARRHREWLQLQIHPPVGPPEPVQWRPPVRWDQSRLHMRGESYPSPPDRCVEI